ncbi:helix-turn-helix domain-containing protein [Novosphingobium panipatense]|uniref:helix-turn-helix domain-containing protein n=1 Tax=Novosphingobium panipatense TaxID=428991 RepID=UPI00399F1985
MLRLEVRCAFWVVFNGVIYDVDVFARISLKNLVYDAAFKKLGATIRTLREAQGISQENFAQRANIERSRYGKIERGELNISLKTLFKVAYHLDVSPDILLGSLTRLDCRPRDFS